MSASDQGEPILVYDVPTCSTCGKLAALLADEAPDVPVTRIAYHDVGISETELRAVLAKAALRPADVLRPKEPLAVELGLPGDHDDDALIALMVEHPHLLQRPLAVRGERAVLARPAENVRELL